MKRSLTCAVLLLGAMLLGAMPLQVFAQHALPDAPTDRLAALTEVMNEAPVSSLVTRSAAFKENLDRQLATSLTSPLEGVREAALKNIITLATLHRDAITLKHVVPEVLLVSRDDANEAFRLMAVAALHALADPYGMRRLREEASEETSPRVYQFKMAVLGAYYR